MKILELRFKNLNSLYGEWIIDFTSPEYVADGIFALTGPTGAGKSTILDAICLALYGATPRMGRITKSSNEIMSRQTGECYAEVTFESQAGRFRCHWAQHRGRKKADGELQNPKHEISEGVENGKVIENQLRSVATAIEDRTGMDFERFTRSILLAQGGFDTFLKADAEQKSKILEQITGTEIYTEISRRVHERQRDEREKLNILEAETSGIVILEPEQEQEIQQDLDAKQKQEVELAIKVTETAKSIVWLTGINGLKTEISSLSEESEKLESELEIFKPSRKRLGIALKAADLDGSYATLTAARTHLEADQTSLKTEEGKLPDLESSAGQKKEALEKAEQLTFKVKEDQKIAAPLIQKVRSLDQRLADQKRAVDKGDADCGSVTEQIKTVKNQKAEELEKRDAAQNELKLVHEYLEANSRDEWFVSGLAGIEEQLGNLLSIQKDISVKTEVQSEAVAAIDAATQKLDGCTRQLNIQKEEVGVAETRLEQGKKELTSLLGDRLLREYRNEKEALLREMAFLSKIADLEEYRLKLEDGKPCPLCGAMEHPFAEGNIPETDEAGKKIELLTDLIQKADELEADIKKFEEAEKGTLGKLAESEKLATDAAHEKKAAEKGLADIAGDLKNTLLRFAEAKDAVQSKLKPLGIEEIPDSDVSLLLTSLRQRLKGWQDQSNRKADIEKQISVLDSELKRFDAVIDTRSTALVEKQTALDAIKKEYETGNLERQELFGDKSPDAEENKQSKAISEAEILEKSVRNAYDEVREKLNSAKVNIASVKERIEKGAAKLKQLESDFATRLLSAGFADEQQFVAAVLPLTERDELKFKAKELDDRQTEMQAKQKDRESRLAAEIARKVTESTLEDLEPVHQECEETLKLLRDAIAGLNHKLSENKAAKERIKEKQSAIEAQKTECNRWEKLHGLIGSADGKKYRNFAQGLTFELMVSHANRQLEKMTDRYLLIRDDDQPLELNVIDNYQAGEIRSTRNLSGGESFIVSLALALGLSKMASRKVRVDSLFLDEGFGTLDEDSLETALETLAGLQQDGKLIGVISHVSALKERISTQITVVPVSGGKSLVTGPGCSKI